MLGALQIRDIVLIEGVDLAFEGGLTVLTGETGAGKSIILDSLGLALGTRAERSLVRAGAKTGSVAATFYLPAGHPARALAKESGLSTAEDSLIFRRVVGADGRARGFVNDQPVSQGRMAELGGLLVEVHGQDENAGLADPSAHRALLDAFAELDLASLKAAYARWREAEERLAQHEAALMRLAQDAAYLTHAAEELESLAPKPDEESALAAERAGFSQNVKLGEAMGEALTILARDGGAAGRLAQTLRRLERLPGDAAALAPVIGALARAQAEATEAEALLEALTQSLAGEPRHLERIEERLHALRAAGRKFSVHPDRLAEIAQDFAQRRDALGAGANATTRLKADGAAAKAGYEALAKTIAAARRAAASRLDALIRQELKPLKLDKAVFETEVMGLEEDQWSAGGTDRVRFLVSTNPGTAKGPLSRIVSGGERARFFLALKAVLARGGDALTLIFDEVDQGVGGAVAAAVGERLAGLARRAQLLIVTHSPQIAARADHHLRIVKAPLKRGGPLVTRVEHLGAEERREEIARMLSGSEITNEARAAAERLMGARRSAGR